MLRIFDTNYPLCLLDTMAVSEMAKRPEGTFKNFLEWTSRSEPQIVPCFTVYTMLELRRKPELFKQFIAHFHPFPCVLLKGYMNFIDEEVAAYPEPTSIDPCALAFTPVGSEGNLLSNLPRILEAPDLLQMERGWNVAAPEIVSGMVSLVKNYPPDGDKYTDKEVRDFIWIAALSQLALHGHTEFIERVHERGEAVDIDAFPSVKAMTYTVFHKFYADPERKLSNSDAFDVLIAAGLPYVEAIITETHLAEALRKTKRRDGFLDRLQVFTLRDFRDSSPA